MEKYGVVALGTVLYKQNSKLHFITLIIINISYKSGNKCNAQLKEQAKRVRYFNSKQLFSALVAIERDGDTQFRGPNSVLV